MLQDGCWVTAARPVCMPEVFTECVAADHDVTTQNKHAAAVDAMLAAALAACGNAQGRTAINAGGRLVNCPSASLFGLLLGDNRSG